MDFHLREALFSLADKERDELLHSLTKDRDTKARLVANFAAKIPWSNAPSWAKFAWLTDDGLFFWTDTSSTDALTKAEFFKRVPMNSSLHGVYRWFERPSASHVE